MHYRINHSKVISQARSVEDCAKSLSSQVQLLEQMEQECRSVWKGDASETFIAKLSSLRAEMIRTRSQISNLASTIRYCADRIQREDQKAAELVAALSSGH